jgi:DNA polymerase IIIc chi subunit
LTKERRRRRIVVVAGRREEEEEIDQKHWGKREEQETFVPECIEAEKESWHSWP